MSERLRRWSDEDWAWVRQEVADAEESRDDIPVRIHAADGWVTIWHTPEEYERLWAGVDKDVAMAMDGFNRA